MMKMIIKECQEHLKNSHDYDYSRLGSILALEAKGTVLCCVLSSVQFSRSVVSDCL